MLVQRVCLTRTLMTQRQLELMSLYQSEFGLHNLGAFRAADTADKRCWPSVWVDPLFFQVRKPIRFVRREVFKTVRHVPAEPIATSANVK